MSFSRFPKSSCNFPEIFKSFLISSFCFLFKYIRCLFVLFWAFFNILLEAVTKESTFFCSILLIESFGTYSLSAIAKFSNLERLPLLKKSGFLINSLIVIFPKRESIELNLLMAFFMDLSES